MFQSSDQNHGRADPEVFPRKCRDAYHFKTSRGDLTIIENLEHPSLWNLYLDRQLIKRDYRDPWQAASDAHRKDFGDEELDQLLTYVAVPDDLNSWHKGKA